QQERYLTEHERRDFEPLLAAAAQMFVPLPGDPDGQALPDRLWVVLDRDGAQQRHVIKLSRVDDQVYVDFDYSVVGPRLLEDWIRSVDATSAEPVLHPWITPPDKDLAYDDPARAPPVGEAWAVRLRENSNVSVKDGETSLTALDPIDPNNLDDAVEN